MKRRRIFYALIATCKVLVLWSVHAEATRWDAWRGQTGFASWYGKRFHGRETASGERFSIRELTAAHRWLPLGTKVLVTNLETAELVEVKINDRGPFPVRSRRIIDLSKAAADRIGIRGNGIGRIHIVVSEAALPRQDAAAGGFYEIQAGAFREREEANQLRDQLQRWYPAAYVTARDGPDVRYYRVRLGPFATRQEALRIASVLTRHGYHVFVDEVNDVSALHARFRPEVGPCMEG